MAKVSLGSNDSGSAPFRLPKDTYKLRIQEEPTFKVSKAGNGYLLFKFEICEPLTKVVDGVERDIAGLELQCNCMLPPINAFMLEALHKGCGLETEIELNDETGLPVGINYAGREVWATCVGEEVSQLNDAQEPMVNPMTGKPLTSFRRNIISFLG